MPGARLPSSCAASQHHALALMIQCSCPVRAPVRSPRRVQPWRMLSAAGRNEHSCYWLAAELLSAYKESHTIHAIVFHAELPRQAIQSASADSTLHHNLRCIDVTCSPPDRRSPPATSRDLSCCTGTCEADHALQSVFHQFCVLCLPARCREHVSRTGCVRCRCTALAAGRPASSTRCVAQHTHSSDTYRTPAVHGGPASQSPTGGGLVGSMSAGSTSAAATSSALTLSGAAASAATMGALSSSSAVVTAKAQNTAFDRRSVLWHQQVHRHP